MRMIYDEVTRCQYDADNKMIRESVEREKSFLKHSRWPTTMEGENPKQGMYLDLYHGRVNKDQDMDDWGSNGPLIGPCRVIHVTYANMIRVGLSKSAGGNEDIDFTIYIDDDLVTFDGVYYGDWSVTNYGGNDDD